ncbi:MAG: DUF3303 family protein [Dehalococcoidia bacterium]
MLFHVTLVHDAAHCPGHHPELGPPLMEALAKRDEIAGRFGVKLHSILNAAPEHIMYVVAEAELPMALAQCLVQLFPFEQQEFRTTPVTTIEDTMAFLQKMGPPPGR